MATYHRIEIDSDAPTLGGVLYLGTNYCDWMGGRSAGKKRGEGPSGVGVEGQRPEFRPVDWLIQEAIEEEGQ